MSPVLLPGPPGPRAALWRVRLPSHSSPPGWRLFFLDHVGVLEIVWSSPLPRKEKIQTWFQRTRVTLQMGANPPQLPASWSPVGLSPAAKWSPGLCLAPRHPPWPSSNMLLELSVTNPQINEPANMCCLPFFQHVHCSLASLPFLGNFLYIESFFLLFISSHPFHKSSLILLPCKRQGLCQPRMLLALCFSALDLLCSASHPSVLIWSSYYF